MTRSVHHVFEAQVAATPVAVAVAHGGERVSYAALDAMANSYARHLRAVGVGPESVVGVLCRRTPSLVAWLLAVWKAGAAYVPLDPDLPAERLGYMLDTAGAELVVSESGLAAGLDGVYTGRYVLADRDAAEIAARSTEPVPRRDDQHGLAYIIFTSGSTGRPKGVQISHRALLNLLFSMRRLLDGGVDDVWLAATSLSFDISGLELYLPLVTGAQLVLAGDDEVGDSLELLRLVDRSAVTHVQATPSGWKLLLDAGFATRPVVALVGGEALPPTLAGELRGRVKRLLNVYGPTETTIWSTTWDVPGDVEVAPIGRPIANTRLYVLDRDFQPVAVGVVGELYIAGDGVARGYVNRPELTAEKFLPEPFGRAAGTRMYRTGDLVRFRPDGNLEFLGRADHQVKIRGHRIELPEIEEHLLTHPDVRNGVVVAREDASGEKWLAGYVVPVDGRPIEPARLRDFLAATLPGYMVPAAFVTLDAMPLNSAGKVDRRALPAPERDSFGAEREFVAPRTGTERRIAEVCARVLDLDQVGAHDRFFDLGADSMRIIQLVSAARQAGLAVSLRMLYQHETVAELAEVIDAEAASTADAEPTVVPGAPTAEPVDFPAPPTAEPVVGSVSGADPSGRTATNWPAFRPVRATSGPSPLATMAREHVPGASVALIRDGEVVDLQGHGVLAAGGSDPVTPETPFQVASISKHVTALGVLRLVRDGTLDLDADINRYLSAWRVPDPARPITVRHLLANLSGLSTSPNTGYAPAEPAPTLLDVLYGRPPATSAPVRPELAPGESFRKTNSHFAVLQQVLVDLTGEPFPELIRALVFAPLGMTGSSFDPAFPTAPSRRVALGHDAHGVPVPDGWRVRPALAAGGLWSTAADLARVMVEIHRAHRNAGPALLTPALAAELVTVTHPGSFYGLGTVVDDTVPDLEFGHPGETVGYRAMTLGRIRAGNGFVVLTNAESGKAVQSFVATELAGWDDHAARKGERRGRAGERRGREGERRGEAGERRGREGERRGEAGERRGREAERRGGELAGRGAGGFAADWAGEVPAVTGPVRSPERSARHLVSINDLTDEDLRSIVTRGAQFRAGTAGQERPLAGDVVGIYFRKTSTRTRTAFSSGALRLGAQIVSYGPDDLQLNTGETHEDTGRVMSRMLEVLVARTAADPGELRMLAAQDRMSVVNAMSADEHPTQALTDLSTLLGHFGRIDGLRVLYVGEGNNTAGALALALPRYAGTHLELRTPPGYGLAEDVVATASAQADRGTATLRERHDMADLPGDFDVIYTTRWQTTGTSKPDLNWREIFAPFQVTADLWAGSPNAIFMHDLPAHRGEEVTAEVLDGPASIAFDQAENKMHSAMAVLEWCRRGPVAGS